ncbi:sigma 54-interacting transcriptional regulator [Salipiger mangrovisoli]|uniref:Sigma 54-interacting transcriptional regulator n=1 Tax=Salipiger mangrovisoli TaxID=2865933 RepID=A0ABR9X9D6_9RHOB|nr:sigma 54-interacting transcriptional regulator [Salipiger mangrovisoli]MBE9640219.1 sigma 54-interacting transcriptional regulator [Salipiger mangrovisoli]
MKDFSSDSILGYWPWPAVSVDPGSDRICAANPDAQRLLGRPLVGDAFLSCIEGNAGDLVVFADAVQHFGHHWTRAFSLRLPAGDPHPCELAGTYFDGADGVRLLIALISLDEQQARQNMTEAGNLHRSGLLEWKRTQSFFSELERHNQLILDAAGEGIYGINADGQTTFVNRAAQEMLGWSAEDLLGHDTHAIIHHRHLNGDHYDHRDCPIYHSFRNERVSRVEDEVFWRKDGRPLQVEYVSTPIYDGQVLAGAVVIFRDISERKENERRLREAMAEVDALRDRLEQENAYLQEEISSARSYYDVVGQAPATQRTLKQLELVAPTDANVLITGESGTGKSLIADALHRASDRRHRSMIRLNCAALPENIDRELFGQVRVNGRGTDKAGRLELANGGTLFLEEVSDLPMEFQGRLLNALRDQSIVRVGDDRARKVNIRIIACTTRDLTREVLSGHFREDLYFFLNVFPIALTPLRERIEDIPLLAAHFLSLACRRTKRAEPTITTGAIRQLESYHWPGNVRELENVIERALIVSTGSKLRIEGLESPQGAPSGKAARRILTDQEMRAAETANLIACLTHTEGRVAGPGGAAELLGLRQTTLYSRIRKLGITEAHWKLG